MRLNTYVRTNVDTNVCGVETHRDLEKPSFSSKRKIIHLTTPTCVFFFIHFILSLLINVFIFIVYLDIIIFVFFLLKISKHSPVCG